MQTKKLGNLRKYAVFVFQLISFFETLIARLAFYSLRVRAMHDALFYS
jgi:hypothetical protein